MPAGASRREGTGGTGGPCRGDPAGRLDATSCHVLGSLTQRGAAEPAQHGPCRDVDGTPRKEPRGRTPRPGGPRRPATHPAARTHQAGWRQEAVDPRDAPHALQALLGLDGDCAQGSAQAGRGHRHLDAGPRWPGQPLPLVRPRPARLPPRRARRHGRVPRAGPGAGAGGHEARASMGGVGGVAAGGSLQQPQGLPRQLGQVRGADVTAALSLRAAGGQDPGGRQLVEEQRREARVLGREQGTKRLVPGAQDPAPGPHPPQHRPLCHRRHSWGRCITPTDE